MMISKHKTNCNDSAADPPAFDSTGSIDSPKMCGYCIHFESIGWVQEYVIVCPSWIYHHLRLLACQLVFHNNWEVYLVTTAESRENCIVYRAMKHKISKMWINFSDTILITERCLVLSAMPRHIFHRQRQSYAHLHYKTHIKTWKWKERKKLEWVNVQWYGEEDGRCQEKCDFSPLCVFKSDTEPILITIRSNNVWWCGEVDVVCQEK